MIRPLFSHSVFLICILQSISSFAQPTNNECANAIDLPNVINYCSAPGAYTSVGATPSINPAQSCWGGQINNDVWFKFVAIASDVSFTVNGNIGGNGTLNRPKAVIVWGDCAGTLNEAGGCNVSAVGQNTVTVYKSPLVIGQTYYIRVSGVNNTTGTFQLCVNNFTPQPSPGSDCNIGTYLCSKDPVTIASVTGAGSNNREAAGTCMDASPPNPIEGNTAWYYWTAGSSGTLTFTLTPTNPADDIDWVLFDLSNGCASKQWLRCCAAGDLLGPPSKCLGPTGMNLTSTDMSEPINCPPTNDNFVRYLDMIQGKSYGLLVENFSSANNGFTLSFGGTGQFLGPTPGYTVSDTTICLGTSITITDTSKNVTTYDWNFGFGATPATSTSTGPHTVTYTTTGTKTIVLTVTAQGGCKMIETKTVNVQACNITATVTSATVCPGACANISATGGGGNTPYSYVWSNGLPSTAGPHNVCPTSTTIYTVTVTDNTGVTASATGTVTVNTPPTLAINKTDVSCFNGTNGTATVTPTGGLAPYTYTWSTAPPQNGVSATGLSPGTYTVTGTDANGCTNTASVTIVQPTDIVPSTNSNPAQCGQTNGSATVSATGGTSPYTYSWATTPVQNGPIATGLGQNTFTVTVTDIRGCTKTATVAVIASGSPTVTNTFVNVLCNGGTTGSIDITVSGGTTPYTYLWSNASTTEDLNNISAGVYTVTVTDVVGCSRTLSVTITEPTALSITPSNTTIKCAGGNDGTATVSATGGTTPYSYNWSNSQTTAGISSLTAGNYSVTVTDKNGCTRTASVTVTEPTALVLASSGTDANCGASDGSATATVTGGTTPYTYSWSGGGGTNAIDPNRSAGIYFVTVTDMNGCTGTSSVTINNVGAPTITLASTNVSCFNGTDGTATVTVNGGVSPYTYNWSCGGTTSSPVNLSVGTCTVTVTSNNGCIVTGTVTISQPTELIPAISKQDEVCSSSNGSASVSASGGTGPYTYLWNSGGTNDTLNNIGTGGYTVTVTDSNNCSKVISTTVGNVADFGPKALFTTNPTVAEILAPTIYFYDQTNGAVTWFWDFGDSTTDSVQNPVHSYKTTGTFTICLTILNQFGCTSIFCGTVVINPIWSFYIPNVFTPDGDGKNEFFKGYGEGIETYEMFIFDRWGDMVYRSNDIAKGWDGLANGGSNLAEEDVYVYLVVLKDVFGKKHRYTGSVTVLR